MSAAVSAAARLLLLRQEERLQRLAEAVGSPPVADAPEHGVLVQRPAPGSGLCRYRQLVTGGAALRAAVLVPRRRRRRVLGHHGRHDIEGRLASCVKECKECIWTMDKLR